MRSGDGQHRRRRRRGRFLFREPDAERRRRGRSDHTLGGADLSQQRPGGLHRDPAHARVARARLFWLPQETLIFEGARLERRLELDTSDEATFIVAETLVFGRLAMGESRIDATLRDSWRVRRDGRLVFADETRLEHAGATLERKAVGAGARALSTIVASAPDIEARLPNLRAALDAAGSDIESGASAFERLIVVRLLAASSDRLRAALVASIVALGGRKPRLWP
jgi:urease accessory protein